MTSLGHIIRKEFLELRQDRRMIPMLIAAPVLQLVLLGFAANLDVTNVPMILVDQDQTRASRSLVDRFTGSGYFQLVGREDDPRAIDRWLIRGKAQIALVIREGYGKAVDSRRAPQVQVIADGAEATSAILALGYASTIIAQQSQRLVLEALKAAALPVTAAAPDLPGTTAAPGGGAYPAPANDGAGETAVPSVRIVAPPGQAPIALAPSTGLGHIDLIPRIWYNPDLRSRWFYVPAILAMVMMLTTMLLPSMAVVREKEIGTLEQLIVTPIRSWELIAGKLIPFALLGLVALVLVTGLAVSIFAVPLRGSLILLVLLSVLFLMTTLGLGLLTSTIARNQQQAMMGSIFLLMVPMIYLSGLIFPIASMPRAIQIVTYGIPLRYYNDVIRGIFLRGAGLSVLWPEALTLALYGGGIFALASLRFRKRLD